MKSIYIIKGHISEVSIWSSSVHMFVVRIHPIAWVYGVNIYHIDLYVMEVVDCVCAFSKVWISDLWKTYKNALHLPCPYVAGFSPFGLGCGDALLSPDAASNGSLGLVSLPMDQPLKIYGTPETELYVRMYLLIGLCQIGSWTMCIIMMLYSCT